jgi:hypothetical protein
LDLGGIALLDMNVDQGGQQIQHFTNHDFAEEAVSSLILITLRCLQLEVGYSFHMLEDPAESLSYITLC